MNFDNYAKCKVCGRDYFKVGKKPLCPKCLAEEESFFKVVREYLYEYPNSSLEEVAEETEIPVELINIWIDEGRLERGSASLRKCKMCGKSISRGSLCKACQNDLDSMAEDLRGSQNKTEKRQMYVAGKKKS
ncbi:MAG: hypothetical protein B6I28_05015 [Fusobacteriia bacterium 4572_132]|nr:MAG: hypothetical protein B6I28_05015 [Fusobacteriia bacterium 4572_132]